MKPKNRRNSGIPGNSVSAKQSYNLDSQNILEDLARLIDEKDSEEISKFVFSHPIDFLGEVKEKKSILFYAVDKCQDKKSFVIALSLLKIAPIAMLREKDGNGKTVIDLFKKKIEEVEISQSDKEIIDQEVNDGILTKINELESEKLKFGIIIERKSQKESERKRAEEELGKIVKESEDANFVLQEMKCKLEEELAEATLKENELVKIGQEILVLDLKEEEKRSKKLRLEDEIDDFKENVVQEKARVFDRTVTDVKRDEKINELKNIVNEFSELQEKKNGLQNKEKEISEEFKSCGFKIATFQKEIEKITKKITELEIIKRDFSEQVITEEQEILFLETEIKLVEKRIAEQESEIGVLQNHENQDSSKQDEMKMENPERLVEIDLSPQGVADKSYVVLIEDEDIFSLVRKSDPFKVRKLFDENIVDLKKKNKKGETPLILAAKIFSNSPLSILFHQNSKVVNEVDHAGKSSSDYLLSVNINDLNKDLKNECVAMQKKFSEFAAFNNTNLTKNIINPLSILLNAVSVLYAASAIEFSQESASNQLAFVAAFILTSVNSLKMTLDTYWRRLETEKPQWLNRKFSQNLAEKEEFKNSFESQEIFTKDVNHANLLLAINNLNYDEVFQCLKVKPHLADIRGVEGQTAFHVAARKWHEKQDNLDAAKILFLLGSLGRNDLTDNYGKKPADYAKEFFPDYKMIGVSNINSDITIPLTTGFLSLSILTSLIYSSWRVAQQDEQVEAVVASLITLSGQMMKTFCMDSTFLAKNIFDKYTKNKPGTKIENPTSDFPMQSQEIN